MEIIPSFFVLLKLARTALFSQTSRVALVGNSLPGLHGNKSHLIAIQH